MPNGKAPEQPQRRRNEESYVFSRSLSETQERILQERHERLEDAKKFRREDVKDKMIKGIIAFSAIFIVLAIIATVVVSCVLGAGTVKKSKGEFVYKVGTKSSQLAYKDAVQNGTIYISMNSIAELCELTLSGDIGNEIRFYTSKGEYKGSYIAFLSNSRTELGNFVFEFRNKFFNAGLSFGSQFRQTRQKFPIPIKSLLIMLAHQSFVAHVRISRLRNFAPHVSIFNQHV